MEFFIGRYLLLLVFAIGSFSAVESFLVSNTSVACLGEAVLFTCSKPGTALRWQVDPPAESGLMSVQSTIFLGSIVGRRDTFGSGVIMFEAVLASNDGGTLTSTLINFSDVSLLDGSNITCTVTIDQDSFSEFQQRISVAGNSFPPLNPSVSTTQNQPSSSIVTLDWDPPSSTGGVSVSYVLTITPTPLSGSPVTVETTSVQITVSYNTPYNVIIRADNCAGSSSDVTVMIPSIVTCPSNPPPADRVTINGAPPFPALLGSTLSFTCNEETVTATCENDRRWSHDPTTYVCISEVTCGSPVAPSGGSVDVNVGALPFSVGSEVTYRCDEGLFPAVDMISTCEVVSGVGTWRPDTSIVCRDGNCTLPEQPSNGIIIVGYERLNETVLKGTVLTYKCDNGLSLTGPNNIICTNAGVWSTEPGNIMCVVENSITASLSTGAIIAISVVISSFLSIVIGFLTGLLVMHLCSRSKNAVYPPETEGQANVADPVYEEVSPKEEIKLNTNQAYRPIGL